jgi:hypothetical protein
MIVRGGRRREDHSGERFGRLTVLCMPERICG